MKTRPARYHALATSARCLLANSPKHTSNPTQSSFVIAKPSTLGEVSAAIDLALVELDYRAELVRFEVARTELATGRTVAHADAAGRLR
jgi:hypothetical protein